MAPEYLVSVIMTPSAGGLVMTGRANTGRRKGQVYHRGGKDGMGENLFRAYHRPDTILGTGRSNK